MRKEVCVWGLCIRWCVGSACNELCWEGSVTNQVCMWRSMPKELSVWGLCVRIYVYKGKPALLGTGPEILRSRAGTHKIRVARGHQNSTLGTTGWK